MTEDHHELSQDRKDAIELARSFGWTVTRKSKNAWNFTRPDTGGLWDLFTIPHQGLCETAVLRKFESYEPDLAEAMEAARLLVHDEFLRARRPARAARKEPPHAD